MSTMEMVRIGTDEVQVMRDEDGTGWLPIQSACELLGVDGRGHRTEIEKVEE